MDYKKEECYSDEDYRRIRNDLIEKNEITKEHPFAIKSISLYEIFLFEGGDLYLYDGNAKNKKFFPPLKSTSQKSPCKKSGTVRQKFTAYMRDHPYIRDPFMRVVTIGGMNTKNKEEGPVLFHFYASSEDLEGWEDYRIFSRKPQSAEEEAQIVDRYAQLMSPLPNTGDTNSSTPPSDAFIPETQERTPDHVWVDGVLN